MIPDHYPNVHEPAPRLFAPPGYNGSGVAVATKMGAEVARQVLEGRIRDRLAW